MINLKQYLDEDVGPGDVTARYLVDNTPGIAVIICEEDAVVAGLEEAIGIFALLGASCTASVQDGDCVRAGAEILTVKGPMNDLVTAERVALNFLMRMSGIATQTRKLTNSIRTVDDNLKVAATRKTTPGFREAEKKAVTLGGGWSHRMGLYDMIMVKDNHIESCGGLENVIRKLENVPEDIKVEIEVTNIEMGLKAATFHPYIIMADHMSPEDTKKMRDGIKNIYEDILVEASGNITADNIMDYAGCADIVSMGALTHSVKAVHYSMDIIDREK